MVYSILLVEDDINLQNYLRKLLLDNGYSIQVANDGIEALNYFSKVVPDLILLDLNLPKMTGESVCREIRKNYKDLPIIVLTAKSETNSLVNILNIGADDYISKPFSSDELLARIKARLRKIVRGGVLSIGDLVVDTQSLEVRRNGKLIQLTPREYKLLHYLMINGGRVLTREMILSRIWMYSTDIETRVVDVYMGYLRRKIDGGNNQKLLKSIRGFGYMISE